MIVEDQTPIGEKIDFEIQIPGVPMREVARGGRRVVVTRC